MTRKAVPATIGARGFDTITAIGPAQASRLKSAGYDFAVRYLGSLSDMEVKTLNEAGIAVMGVTYGGAFDGAAAVVNAREKAKLPPGTSLWLDLEGQDRHRTGADITTAANAWYDTVAAAGYLPGLYVGSGCVLDAGGLYRLKFTRYWRSCSLVPKPSCGWSCIQLYPPNQVVAGVQIDIDVIESDYRGRVPAWCVTA